MAESMKTLIFSDTHLTGRFNKKKSQFLEEIIRPADRVVMNGDFWDHGLCSFDRFVASQWRKKLFPLLKKREAVYVFGNHDQEKWIDSRVELFSDKAVSQYQFIEHGKKYLFEHGHREYPAQEFLSLILQDAGRYVGVPYLLKLREVLTWKVFGWGAHPKMIFNAVHKRLSKEGEFDTCFWGHTHSPEVDLESKFVNSGCVEFGFGSYIMIEEGNIDLIKRRY
ncbi:hypothetical protein GF357_00210 [Candidatus Dojkabacteria bacterium]|nr:hypothetical protein [Candidatus Dojkabacteria bacterium]